MRHASFFLSLCSGVPATPLRFNLRRGSCRCEGQQVGGTLLSNWRGGADPPQRTRCPRGRVVVLLLELLQELPGRRWQRPWELAVTAQPPRTTVSPVICDPSSYFLIFPECCHPRALSLPRVTSSVHSPAGDT